MADGGAFTSWYVKTRARTLKAIRDGSQPNPLPVPVGDLPAE
jgi:hypothetical protein